jgi:hypothetical protein
MCYMRCKEMNPVKKILEHPNPFDKERGEKVIPKSAVLNFLKQHPRPSDATVHTFAKRNNFEVDDVEEAIYKIAGEKVRRR